jgi:hypothetical protein
MQLGAQRLPDAMRDDGVSKGISELRLGKFGRRPVRDLLGLVERFRQDLVAVPAQPFKINPVPDYGDDPVAAVAGRVIQEVDVVGGKGEAGSPRIWIRLVADYSLVFTAPQGLGKDLILEAMFEPYYREGVPSPRLSQADFALGIAGAMVAHGGEMWRRLRRISLPSIRREDEEENGEYGF